MGPQLVPIENMYDSNNIPDVIYQDDISKCDNEDNVSAIPPCSMEEIASTSTCSVLPNIIIRDNVSTPKKRDWATANTTPSDFIQDEKDSSQGGCLAAKTPKIKKKSTESDDLMELKKKVQLRKLEILKIVKEKEIVELDLKRIDLEIKKTDLEIKKTDLEIKKKDLLNK
ncbi:unnamed protein product [Diabrotica balteata]|uniref:Uncharacterized protein n=1 Tax=Diabrotica balteata TaxID=107213 RepID=A0A9P0DXS8_DIABA|nr:unnamed protein product [Diabrotica balteata]